jgi:lysophospholipase L1-like esterase
MAQQTYLALGDSYTICEGLDYEESWPFQLTKRLSKDGLQFHSPKIIAKTGWRTDELIEAIDKELEQDVKYDLVSLLIGVNNQYQEKPLKKYKKEFKELLDEAIYRSKTAEKGVFVVSIPDYGVTPFAKNKNKTDAIEDLKKYNDYAKKLCEKANIVFYNITPISQALSLNQEMLIEDELHPSYKQYQAWIESFYNKLLIQLKE